MDANVVFSSLVSGGKPLKVFELNRLFGGFEFIAPEYLFFEIEKRAGRILEFTKFSEEELTKISSFIKREIEFIPLETFKDRVEEAKLLSPHLKDLPYVALSLKFDCMILSGDKGLKRRLPDKVVNPSEAIGMLFDGKHR